MRGGGVRVSGWALLLPGLAAGVLFFTSLGKLWPLADTELSVPRETMRRLARAHLESLGFDLEGYRAANRVGVVTEALDYVDRSFGREQTQRWINEGWPLVSHTVYYKKRGESVTYAVRLHPSGKVLGWSKEIQEDHPGSQIAVDEARELARQALTRGLGLDAAAFEEQSASTTERIDRRDHRFGFERVISASPELRERVTITVAGEELVGGSRWLVVPETARRAARARQAPGMALETLGFAMVAVAGIAAFFIFLARLKDGSVKLSRAAVWPALVFFCLMTTFMLESASLFSYWEPLWPRWISDSRYFVLRAMEQAWLLLFLLALVAAGNALDSRLGAGRGESLFRLGRGRLFDPLVALASGRGFLVGLLCGGVMTLAVVALGWLAGATTSIQPRGFFFYTLNSASPALTSVLFFLGVALTEELGYRYFGGGWMLQLTGRRWVAVLIPALMYGLTHTRMDFLPPADPFWARALVLTLVGCVWGWAFLRFDALTVVLSHLTADLFIFNWPQLATGDAGTVALSLLTICVPLVPALGYPLFRLARRPGGG